MKLFKKPGTILVNMDGQNGSIGKAKVISHVARKLNDWQFCFNNFSCQAAHWTRLDDGREFLYKTLNSMAYDVGRYEKMYIGPGAAIEVETVLQELEENNIPAGKLGIHPLTVVVQDIDKKYEMGLIGFDGEPASHTGTMKTGSTCSGVSVATARRVMRRPNALLAKDVPELKPFICDVSSEIIDRLENGQNAIGELPQGWALSNTHPLFYPYVTYRQVSVSQFFADMQIPIKYAGPVIIGLRTYPIRINSNKYIAKEDGRHLTWDEVMAGISHDVYEGNSGPGYPDQEELSWEYISEQAGKEIMEITSKTKLPRRVFGFSKIGLEEAIRFNDAGHGVYLALNFADYLDKDIAGKRGGPDQLTDKVNSWIDENIGKHKDKLITIGTGPKSEDTIDYQDYE